MLLNTTYIKVPPKKINSRDYKKFSEPNIGIDLARNLSNSKHENLGDFEETFAKTLQKHAPYKSVLVHGNNKPHVIKNLRKAIKKRARLKTMENRTGTDRDIRNYKSQRNLVVKMNRQATKELYANLDPTEIGNSREIFKQIFTKGTVNTNEKIFLVEDGSILHDDKTIGECFNSYFVNITDTLDFPKETISAHEDVIHEDPVLQAINKYQRHPSIQMIKENVGHLVEEDIFEFSHFNPVSVWNEINQLNNTNNPAARYRSAQ